MRNLLRRYALYLTGVIALVAASFAAGMMAGAAASARGDYGQYLTLAFAVAIIAILVSIIVLLVDRRGRR